MRQSLSPGSSHACKKRPHWHYAGMLLMEAGTSGKAEDIEEATLQMRRALRVEGVVVSINVGDVGIDGCRFQKVTAAS